MSEDIILQSNEIKQHTIGQSLVLHLLPGILIGVFYFAIIQPVRNLGYPSILALVLAAIAVLIPFELGFLLYQGKKAGTKSLEGIVLYRQKIQLREYLIWVPIIFVLMGLLFTILTPISDFLEGLFNWLPETFQLDTGLTEEYSKSVLIITYVLVFIFVVIIDSSLLVIYLPRYILVCLITSLFLYKAPANRHRF